MKYGSSVMVTSAGAGWPAITPSTTFTTCSISCRSSRLRLRSSFFACCATATDAENASMTITANARRIAITSLLSAISSQLSAFSCQFSVFSLQFPGRQHGHIARSYWGRRREVNQR